MAKNLYSLQLLRNGTPFTSYAAAVNAITGGTEQDGVLKLARYTQSGDGISGKTNMYNTNGEVRTIFGIRHSISGGTSGWTIYNSYDEVIKNIQYQIDTIAGGGEGSIAQQIEDALDALDFTGVTTGDGVVVTNVTETNGKVSATAAEVGGLKLTNYSEGSESGHVAANDSINAAIAKLQNQIDAANDAKNAAIEALDYTDTAVTGSYVSKVDEADGVISVTRVALPSAGPFAEAGKPITAVSETLGEVSASAGTINAEFVNVTGDTFTANNVQAALEEIETEYKAADAAIVGNASESGNTLGKLEDRIEALDADAKEYSIKQITTGLSTNVKEAWGLFDADNHQSGATINIYKDSAYKEIYLGTAADTINTTTGEITKQTGDKQSLNYAYMKADGTYDLVKVDVSSFLSESEFQSGVTAVDHIVRGVVDPSSDTFLTVGADGFKLAGVQAAINAASGDAQTKINALSGKAVTEITSTDGSIATAKTTAADGTISYNLSTDASKVDVSTAYTAATGAIATGDSVDTALAKLEDQVAKAKAAATKVAKDANANHLTVTTGTGANNETIYTIGENDIASKTDLDAEIAARKAVDGQDGQTYAANANTNYISGATSLNDADVKLDAAIKALEGAAQTEIDAIESAVGLGTDGTHQTSTGNYTSAATTIEGEIVDLDRQVKANADAIDALENAFVSGATMNGTAVAKANNTLAFTANYTNTAAESEDGMVITTGNNGGLTFQFGTLDCGEYN